MMFASIDKDGSGSITANELTTVNFGGRLFTLATAKMLVSVFDTDRSGSIGFFEFAAMHKFIGSMVAAFNAHDRDRSGRIDVREACDAVGQAGFRFNVTTIQTLVTRFERRAMYGAVQQSGLDMETFLQMCAYLGQIKSTFELQDTDRDGWININLENLVLVSVFVFFENFVVPLFNCVCVQMSCTMPTIEV
jgi:peflin